MKKVIILDGVGINLKSTITKRLGEDYGVLTLTSDTQDHLGLDGKCLVAVRKMTSKAVNRFLQMNSVYKLLGEDGILVVDRGAMNMVIWADLLFNDRIDDYLQDKEDYRILMDNYKEILDLENRLDPIRFLMINDCPQIVEDSLARTDLHAQRRLETFYHLEGYYEVQEDYLNKYRRYLHGNDYTELVLHDPKRSSIKSVEESIDQMYKTVVDKLMDLGVGLNKVRKASL